MPNSGCRGLERLEYRTKSWDKDFQNYLKQELEIKEKKPVILCGDLNVAHLDIDIHNPKVKGPRAGFTPEERNSFGNFIKESGFVDNYRLRYPRRIQYSFWTALGGARKKNQGWRLDYFMTSNSL